MKRKGGGVRRIAADVWLIAAAVLIGWMPLAMAADPLEKEIAREQKGIHHLEDVTVKAKTGAPGLEQNPSKMVIQVENFNVIGPPGDIEYLLKSQAIIDFRGQTDLVPDSDTLTMRGFSSDRFVMAVDGLTVQKTGGRKGAHIVDYTLLSPLPIEKIEIIAGPHSALYDNKGIGGVVNIITQAPRRREMLMPDVRLSASYGTYNTQKHQVNAQGAVDAVTYGMAFQRQSTDGYLRNSGTDIKTCAGSIGTLLPFEGFVNFSAAYSIVDRHTPVNNTGDGHDPDFPEVQDAAFDAYQKPTWNKDASSYRLNYQQNLPAGRLTFAACRSKEDRDRAYWTWVDGDDPDQGLKYSSGVTTWRQEGAKIQDEYKWADSHISTIGYEAARLYDGDEEDERVNKKGAFFQHQWFITPSLDVNLGLRYENLRIWSSNRGIPGKGDWIKRKWAQWAPKSYTTWKMDKLTPWLRDTSLCLGISRIWHVPDSHGYYNPQGRPTGAWLDPEHGMGYDIVLNRRLWGDVDMMLDYSFYKIKDYMAHNSEYARYTSSAAGDLIWSDYMVNLEEVRRQGLELNLGGHLLKDLFFFLSYAWQKYENQGSEPAGETALDDEAEHRVCAGLRYALCEKTCLMIDYYYQSEEVSEESEETNDVDQFGEPVYIWRQVDNPSYQLFHVGIEQKLFMRKWFFKDARIKFYIKNLLDEVYYDDRGYPSTDRTCGVTLSVRM